jgi:hypothetical protein
MPIITLIIGAILGFTAGMIVAAGSWRNALAKLGAYATNAAKAPAVTAPAAMEPAVTAPAAMPIATRIEDQPKPM